MASADLPASQTGVQFGVSLAPRTEDIDTIVKLAVAADDDGLDLLAIQDHPYVAEFLDTFSLIGHLLSRTTRITVFPDVANLPLRPPAMLAKAAATLDLLSGGRFELGLGGGASMDAVAAMGGSVLARRDALPALAEAIDVIRALWRSGENVHGGGEHYRVDGVDAGPAPAHAIGIWLGSIGPRALELTGRVADGWAAPIPNYLAHEDRAEAQDRIDAAARAAGRDPHTIRRLAQLPGTITDDGDNGPPVGNDPIIGPPQRWVDTIDHFVRNLRYDTVIFWPDETSETQVHRFTDEVIPGVRARLGHAPRA
jgi:alkanesulfonate monooxygenase SsuD/methylene tetrahydromethanopterin reductase-like flavin-dependent oxidoreductase (luciferase family)